MTLLFTPDQEIEFKKVVINAINGAYHTQFHHDAFSVSYEFNDPAYAFVLDMFSQMTSPAIVIEVYVRFGEHTTIESMSVNADATNYNLVFLLDKYAYQNVYKALLMEKGLTPEILDAFAIAQINASLATSPLLSPDPVITSIGETISSPPCEPGLRLMADIVVRNTVGVERIDARVYDASGETVTIPIDITLPPGYGPILCHHDTQDRPPIRHHHHTIDDITGLRDALGDIIVDNVQHDLVAGFTSSRPGGSVDDLIAALLKGRSPVFGDTIRLSPSAFQVNIRSCRGYDMDGVTITPAYRRSDESEWVLFEEVPFQNGVLAYRYYLPFTTDYFIPGRYQFRAVMVDSNNPELRIRSEPVEFTLE